MAEGIRRRHSEGCNSREGGRCNCNAGWEASVYLAREGRKLRRTFAREAEAKTWRADALVAANARSLRTPSQITVEQAAWLWLEAARTGAVRDRSGHHYKPGTLREYGRALSLRVLPEFGGVRLSELTRADLQDFVDRLLGRKLAASTIRNTITRSRRSTGTPFAVSWWSSTRPAKSTSRRHAGDGRRSRRPRRRRG
jgi:hypothetical protein